MSVSWLSIDESATPIISEFNVDEHTELLLFLRISKMFSFFHFKILLIELPLLFNRWKMIETSKLNREVHLMSHYWVTDRFVLRIFNLSEIPLITLHESWDKNISEYTWRHKWSFCKKEKVNEHGHTVVSHKRFIWLLSREKNILFILIREQWWTRLDTFK
jgi:hypothetical protein